MTIMVDQYGVCDSIHRSVNSHFHLLWYMGDVRSEERGRGGRLFGLCVFCTMLRSSSSYSISQLCISVNLLEKNIKHMKIYL